MKKFEIIETSDYVLAVSEEEIKKGDLCYDLDNVPSTEGRIVKCLRTAKDTYWNKYCKKIIAYQPKNNAPELDLPLLPEMVVEDEKSFIEKGKKHWGLPVLEKFEGGHIKSSTLKELIDAVIENTWKECKRFLSKRIVEDDVEKLAEEYKNKKGSIPTTGLEDEIFKLGFKDGYKAATKVYSEEDLRKAMEIIRSDTYKRESIDSVIQSLKQPKPKWFVAEVINTNSYGSEVSDGSYDSGNFTFKTTTNSQGKQVLVGIYKYK